MVVWVLVPVPVFVVACPCFVLLLDPDTPLCAAVVLVPCTPPQVCIFFTSLRENKSKTNVSGFLSELTPYL